MLVDIVQVWMAVPPTVRLIDSEPLVPLARTTMVLAPPPLEEEELLLEEELLDDEPIGGLPT
jgi:hypothetical protein